MTVTPARIQGAVDDPVAQLAAHGGELGPVVDAERLARGVGEHRGHRRCPRRGSADHVGEVLLALGVVGGQPGQRVAQQRVRRTRRRWCRSRRWPLAGGRRRAARRSPMTSPVVVADDRVRSRSGRPPSAVSSVAALPAGAVLLDERGQRRPRSAAARPRQHHDGAVDASGTASSATRTACPVPFCCSCTTASASGRDCAEVLA